MRATAGADTWPRVEGPGRVSLVLVRGSGQGELGSRDELGLKTHPWGTNPWSPCEHVVIDVPRVPEQVDWCKELGAELGQAGVSLPLPPPRWVGKVRHVYRNLNGRGDSLGGTLLKRREADQKA